MNTNNLVKILNFLCLSTLLYACQGQRPSTIGTKNAKLFDCPKSPNCVSSFASNKNHYMTPLQMRLPAVASMRLLRALIKKDPSAHIVKTADNYLYVEYTSKLFKFVDDVEFLIDEKTKQIHLRSASRKGRSDFGVNRKRLEKIRAQFSPQA